MASSGPIYLDCRQMSGAASLRRLEGALKKSRAGARMVILRTDESEVVEVIQDWAEAGCARYTLSGTMENGEPEIIIRIFLLPHDFDAHPFLAWRPVLTSTPDLAATPPMF